MGLAATAGAQHVNQLVCTDTGCSQNCQLNTFPENTCISAAAGGGMMFLQCDGTGVIYNSFNAADCSGTGERHEDGVGTCLTSASSGSFINSCSSSTTTIESPRNGTIALGECASCFAKEETHAALQV